jgi:radical SAM/Cys-rich protein
MDDNLIPITPFRDRMLDAGPEALTAGGIRILQVNLGYRCNMSCKHCHVEARPDRDELMNKENVGAVLAAVKNGGIGTLDITGGAPEMNRHFKYLVEQARKAGCRVSVRTNLTIFFEDGGEYLPKFMNDHSVEVVASLPYYTESDVDRVRGKGTFEKCIGALRMLNRLGYGSGCGDKKLNLVYNPPGAFLPPVQKTLEEDYKIELDRRFGVSFDALYTFSNMPIGRFRDYLLRTGGLEKYTAKLVCAFNPDTIPGLMCRQLISVGWDGRLYDCDFNQMLGLAVHDGCPQNIKEFDLSRLAGRTITVGDHCYACTAGQGST